MKRLTPPTDPVANIRYRQELRQWAVKSRANRKWLLERCREDFYFWLESFAWLYEPRPDKTKDELTETIPFLPWPHQRPIFDTTFKHLGKNDIGLKKSRGEGATWIYVEIFVYEWLFSHMSSFGIVSMNEHAADSDNPDSIGAKIDWTLGMLPQWMVGPKGAAWFRNKANHTWVRRKNLILPEDCSSKIWSADQWGPSITAFPTSGDLASGGRKTAFLFDELAKHERGPDEEAVHCVEPVTDCRILLSTFKGANGAYYKAITSKDSSLVLLTLGWQDNPTRNQAMFRIDSDKLVLRSATTDEIIPELIGEYTNKFFNEYFPKLYERGYPVHSHSKVWSPWYVERCLRPLMTPQAIAQEYDMDPMGSGHSFFPSAIIDRLLERAQRPVFEGELEINLEELTITGLIPRANGSFKLWYPHAVGHIWRPPTGRYVLGVDVASGAGGTWTSNSVISVAHVDTGKKLAEYASQTTKPEELCEIAIALCRWFQNYDRKPAYLIWETNGHGVNFRERLLLTDFRNVYFRTPRSSSRRKSTKEPGWFTDNKTKRDLLGKYRWSLQQGYFDNPSKEALNECMAYVEAEGNKIVYSSNIGHDVAPSDVGELHGDRVIADALANFAIEELGGGAAASRREKLEKKNHVPPGSFAARRQERQRRERDAEDWLA